GRRAGPGGRLLEGFLRAGGTMSVQRAYEALKATQFDPETVDLAVLEQLDPHEVFKVVKVEISHLRGRLRHGVREPGCLPIGRYEQGVGYRLRLQIGFSVTDLDEGNRSTGNFNFMPVPGTSRQPGSPSAGTSFPAGPRTGRATRHRLR